MIRFANCYGYFALLVAATNSLAAEPIDLRPQLAKLRESEHLPALGAAVLSSDGVQAIGVVGVRKWGDPTPATLADQFHLGSCTKAMTATLIARFVERGQLSWDTTIAQGLPEIVKSVRAEYRKVTLLQLLSHRAGLPGSGGTWPEGMTGDQLRSQTADIRTQRLDYARRILEQKPVAAPGSKYVYSNAGYVIAAAILERAANQSWEVLMQKELFTPLGMTSAGFGAAGVNKQQAGRINQPWGHTSNGKEHKPIPAGPKADNPAVIWPAGGVHCSLADWAKFVDLHLRGARGQKQLLLKPQTFRTLQTPHFGDQYALGWFALLRPNGDLYELDHSGSNTINFALVRIYPQENLAVLVVTNQAGRDTDQIVDKICAEVRDDFRKQSK